MPIAVAPAFSATVSESGVVVSVGVGVGVGVGVVEPWCFVLECPVRSDEPPLSAVSVSLGVVLVCLLRNCESQSALFKRFGADIRSLRRNHRRVNATFRQCLLTEDELEEIHALDL